MEDKALFESDWHRKGWHLFGVFDGCVSRPSPSPSHFIYPSSIRERACRLAQGSHVIRRWLLSLPALVLPASRIYRMSRLHLWAWHSTAMGYATNLTTKA